MGINGERYTIYCIFSFWSLLRRTGKRQAEQLAPFDLVLLPAPANAVQNSMKAGDNALSGGLITATTLIGLFFLSAWRPIETRNSNSYESQHSKV